MNRQSYVQLLSQNLISVVFSFIEGIMHDMGTLFRRYCHTFWTSLTMPLHQKLDIEASTRISLSFLNTIEECRTFLDVLDNTVRYFDEE